MQTIRSLIVDDEKFSRVSLKKLLKPYSQIEIVDEAADGLQAIEKIEARKPDLVFLDIQMPGLNGFEVLRALTIKPKPQVIFVTAFDQYAVKAFEVNAIDYLLKPIDEARLQQAIGKLNDNGRAIAEEYEKIRQFILHMEQPKYSLPAHSIAAWTKDCPDESCRHPLPAVGARRNDRRHTKRRVLGELSFGGNGGNSRSSDLFPNPPIHDHQSESHQGNRPGTEWSLRCLFERHGTYLRTAEPRPGTRVAGEI